ncbi:hypothetical protein CNEO2_310045 [Clostridium neonatale]|uniref:Uncharacterized protein n=1 Tax=Clostridium neonatale TaxID=137838 RepID=A0AAD1YFK8_9CLOT|nr:hypothetical protein CNEO2_260043 [Clostridium neonatale]CAI3202993.1 hypothetical protein CNEO2_220036 [Clostridium neonatale]CAI3203393.1 hypothetical protein CNEO2_290045 [Clostridium neonatale]CAI3230811.1 hypothetical protein CNEO2_190044 [Clostridium neonatale]CAI3233757.1 hypothetical protein CNEO2_210043 [Clostridium neonatale]
MFDVRLRIISQRKNKQNVRSIAYTLYKIIYILSFLSQTKNITGNEISSYIRYLIFNLHKLLYILEA